MMDKEFTASRFEDIIKSVLKSKRVKYTDFLSPSEQKIFEKTILKYRQQDINYNLEGGYPFAERKIAIIYFDFLQPEDTPICAVRIEGNFSNLSHRDVLGSLLGLGIRRQKIGDIIVKEDKCDILLHKDVESYVLMNFFKVGKEKVRVSSIDLKDVMEPEIRYKDIFSTVASLRVDSVAAAGFGISRTKASQLIKSGLLQINWEYTDDPSSEVKEGDVISLRGFGRIRLEEVRGNTKKGRVSVHILRFI
ncbi:RNA-binding S4 domain protein [Thermoanaerobacter mathranii subsp. mathranii str. A3]|jgi:RNA-binding protein YlmH|uniref:RNA-binding S4 domain protein n=2 Tax=Thermoanaerobacter TaxID=1754 RepID=A0ABN3Z305_THEM3|nr:MULTISPECIES: YlmH/Sll1252 family protein [Thermoanaerobacter]ADH61147.1 RNA-binding S4 domain protein [Thermoanaerobacter mathranii subsp. mathranii str. A3]